MNMYSSNKFTKVQQVFCTLGKVCAMAWELPRCAVFSDLYATLQEVCTQASGKCIRVLLYKMHVVVTQTADTTARPRNPHVAPLFSTDAPSASLRRVVHIWQSMERFSQHGSVKPLSRLHADRTSS